jgi:lipopolysaccharide heptosyltransferase II
MGSRLLRHLERAIRSAGAGALRFLVSPGSAPITRDAEFDRILVIRQHNQLGDMLCVVPMLRALRRKYPRAHIALLASPVNFDVMVNNEFLNETILFDKSQFVSRRTLRLLKLISFVRDLRSRRFDLAVVPATVSISATSNLLAYLSGAQIRIGPRSIDGHKNRTALFFNVQLILDWSDTPERHQTERNLEYLSPLKIEGEKELSSAITLNQQEKVDGKSFILAQLNDKTSIIVFHPGAGKIPNRWPAQNFALVANILSMEFDAFVMITAGAFDGDPVQDMVSTLSVPYQVIRNKPIRLVASILSEADLLVTNDTGIMHVGGAVGAPVLSLFGPTEPYQWAPIGPAHRFVQSKEKNIDSIPVDEVLRHAREMLRLSRMIRSGDRPFLAER